MIVQFAHGVGRVYELPIPLWLYLVAAAGTVLVSFVIRTFASRDKDLRAPERRVAGPGIARGVVLTLRGVALFFLVLTVAAGAFVREPGLGFATLSLWVGLVVGMTFLSSFLSDSWAAADPWATTERFYRLGEVDDGDLRPPWWTGAAAIYVLFWFELISGVGFDAFWVAVALGIYSLIVFSFRNRVGQWWHQADPLAVLFGFAGRCAPWRLAEEGIYRKSPVAELSEDRPMPLALYAALFMVLASTTLDNVRETVGWSNLMRTLGLDGLSPMLTDSVALLLFAIPFWLTFRLATNLAHSSLDRKRSAGTVPAEDEDTVPAEDAVLPEDTARRFAWSMIPIAVAYILAHNAPLFITGAPQLLRALSDPFELGWNVLKTSHLFEGFTASPKLVWFLEIAIIVGGHILAVLAAHRTAVMLAPDHARAVRSQYALTALMSIYTIATLWLLAQPLIA